MSVISLTNEYLDKLWELRDKRMDVYPLMSSPLPTLILCTLYVILVTSVGPILMKNRPALELRTAMFVYNLFQVLYSAWLFYDGLRGGWWNHYSFRCQPVDYSNSERALIMMNVSWFYYFGRFIEFFDTFFFVLRKKFRQVSFLHVAHHAVMPMFMWPFVRYMPGGHSTFAGVLNSLVHVFMYGYYLMASLGPQYKNLLWWKQYMTNIQLTQFFTVLVHSIQLLFVPDCGYPYQQAYAMIILMIFFILLFSHFYVQTYLNKPDDKEKKRN